MKCTNENFRNVVCLLRYWPRGDVRDMVAWTATRKRICGDEESEENRSGRKWFGIIMTETDYRERYMVRRVPTKQDPASLPVLPSRLWSCEDRICCFVPPKTFLRNKTLLQIHLVRFKTFIRDQIMWTPTVWP